MPPEIHPKAATTVSSTKMAEHLQSLFSSSDRIHSGYSVTGYGSGSLAITVQEGVAIIGGRQVGRAGDGTTSLTLTASSTNYIYVRNNAGTGVVSFNTTGVLPADSILLWEVTTDGTGIPGAPVDSRDYTIDLGAPLRVDSIVVESAGTISGALSLSLTGNQPYVKLTDTNGGGVTARIYSKDGFFKVTNDAASVEALKLNMARTVVFGHDFSMIGAFAVAFTSTATTTITLPTTGTLATLAGAETLTNKTLTSPIITNIAPGANFTLTQNSVAVLTSVNAGAVANTLYLSAGNVGIGTTPSYQLHGYKSSGDTEWAIENVATNSASSYLYFRKSRGAVVQANEVVGAIHGYGYDGAAYRQAAAIQFEVDGTPGSSDMPGRIVFYTTADGASSVTERLRISSAGLTSVTGTFSVSGASTLTGNVFLASGANKVRFGDTTAPAYAFEMSGTYVTAAFGAMMGLDVSTTLVMRADVNGDQFFGITVRPTIDKNGKTGLTYKGLNVGGSATGSGTIDTAYGVYVTGPTIGTTNYALYVASGTSQFNGALIVSGNGTNNSFSAMSSGSLVLGQGAHNALATNATTGFIGIPHMSGTPTGTPDTGVGSVVWDYTNFKLYIRDNAGGWKSVTFA